MDVKMCCRNASEGGRVASEPFASPTDDKLSNIARYLKSLPDKSKLHQKQFTKEEVSNCDGKEGRPLYLVIDNCVYDFGDFTQYHPAGPEHLEKHAGSDASTAIRQSGMSSAAYQPYLSRFQVGKLVDYYKSNSTNVKCSN